MTSNGWAEAVLVLVVLAPLAAVVVPLAVALPDEPGRWTTIGCAVSAAGAAVLLIAGQRPQVSRLAPDDLALAAAAATGLLATGQRAIARAPTLAAAATVVMCGIAAGVPGRPSTVGPLLGIVAAIGLVALTRDAGRVLPVAIGVGAVVVGAGLRSGGRGGAAAVVLGAALVACLATTMRRTVVVVVVPAALVLGLRVAPTLAGTSTARWVTLVLGIGAVAVVAARSVGRWSTSALCTALVPWVFIAAIDPVPGMSAGARLLAAGAVLALLLGGPLALLVALPGGAIVTYAIADAPGWPRIALAVLLALTVGGLLRERPADVPARLRVVDGIGVALGGWLVVRPTTWTWAGVSDVTSYNDGTVLAVASVLIAGVALVAHGRSVDAMRLAPWVVSADPSDDAVPGGTPVVTFVATLATAVAAALLLRSARL